MEADEENPVAATPTASRTLTAMWNIAKWVIMVLAVAYLWREGALSSERLRLSSSAAWGLPLAALFLSLSVAAMSVRFHVLLRGCGCPSVLAGQFKITFSALLMQQIGSDAAFDVMRVVGGKTMGGATAGIVAALMADRLLGLMALTAIAAVVLPGLWDGPEGVLLAAAVALALVAVPAVLVLFTRHVRARPGSRLLRIPGSGFLAAVGASIAAYRGGAGVLAALFALSLAAHGCVFTALYFCGVSLAGAELAPLEAMAGGALSTFTGALPLPMAGLGVGEMAFGATVARLRGVGDAGDFAAIFLVNRLLLLTLGVVAWLWLALAKNRR